jgi:hypothetical protein
METLIIIWVLIAIAWVLGELIVKRFTKQMTAEEWNEKLSIEFEKYGPVPDDVDTIKRVDFLKGESKCTVCFSKEMTAYIEGYYRYHLVCGQCGAVYKRESTNSDFKISSNEQR